MTSFKLWYAVAALFVSLFFAVGVSILYAHHAATAAQRSGQEAIRLSQQQLCAVLVPIDAAYHQPPPNEPQTELGRQLAARFDALVKQYNCVKE